MAAMLAHTAFFDKLESLREFGDEWKAVFAGLMVLRLVDSWLDGEFRHAHDGPCMVAVREGLSNMPGRDASGTLLREVTDRIAAAGRPRSPAVASALLRYAQTLMDRAEWALARDVAKTVYLRATRDGDFRWILDAGMMAATLSRWMGDVEWSETVYPVIEAHALQRSDEVAYLRCQIGYTNSLNYLGHWNKAWRRLQPFIERIEMAGSDALMVHACHAAMQSQWRCNNPVGALHWGRRALEHATGTTNRHIILSEMAASHMVAGRHDTARDILSAVKNAGGPANVVNPALGNLLEIAVMTGDRQAFERYSRELNTRSVFPNELAHHHYVLGVGYRKFGGHRQAVEELRKSVDVARRNQLSVDRRRAERVLRAWGVTS